MEAVGTAVGIASLGIQVCQGFLSYYDNWKDYDSDVRNTYDAITDLSKTLTLLKSTLDQGDADEERAVRVTTCMRSCEDLLLELEKKRQSLQRFRTPVGTRERAQSLLQQSSYPWRKDTLAKVKANVIEVQEHLVLSLQVLQLHNDTAAQKLLHELQEQSAAQGASLAQMSAQNQRIVDLQFSEQYKNISAWLSAADPWTNHESARQRHETQTGDWLLQCKKYEKWKLGRSNVLWMFGKAGCGKTVLCSTAIEDIRNHCQHNTDTTFAFFYFSFSDVSKQSDQDLLRSLVTQLCWREPGLSMLREAYGNPGQSVPGSAELETILLASISSCNRVYLFLDALDECPEEHDMRRGVLERIARLSSHASNISILVTSRELSEVRESMVALKSDTVRIAPSVVDADIQIYVANQLSRERSFRKFPLATLRLIETTIAIKADGMFRWAYCQLQELKKLKSAAPKYAKLALDALPATLNDTYAQMLTGIEEIYHQQAFTLLQWLAYARSPPTLGELIEAAITDYREESTIDVENRGNLEDTLNILSGLVTTQETGSLGTEGDSQSEPIPSDVTSGESDQAHLARERHHLKSSIRVRLAHFSVKEYLESKRILKSDANHFFLQCEMGHRTLAQSCLAYLRHYSVSCEKTLTKSDLETFPMLRYAASSWYHHSILQLSEGFRREARFLHSDKVRYDWLLVHDPDMPLSRPFCGPRRLCSPIYYASLLGLRSVVSELCSNGADVNARGGRYGNSLQAASHKGYTALVQQLLDKDANVNARGREFGNALQAASEGGHVEVLQLLLNNGANVNVEGGFFGYALQAASYKGLTQAVCLLLENGADIWAQGGWYGCAIQAASAEGHTGVVQLLIEKGVDVSAPGGGFGTALQAASWRGQMKVVQLLLKNGADVNSGVGFHGNPLYAAAENGHTEVVQLLLDNGADVNAQGGQYGNALQAAADRGYTEVVRLLLDRNADVNAQGGLFSNALQAASFRGHVEVVLILLGGNADMDAQGTLFSNAVEAALGGDHAEVIQLLLHCATAPGG